MQCYILAKEIGLKNVTSKSIFDDVLLYGRTFDSILSYFRTVMCVLKLHQAKLKLKRCKIF